jgi:hypothetical protein
MTTTDLEQARAMIDAGDLKSFYAYMADQGFNYAVLGGGLVSGSMLVEIVRLSTLRRPRFIAGGPKGRRGLAVDDFSVVGGGAVTHLLRVRAAAE